MAALNPVNPIQSASATATNGSKTVTVTGNVDCSFIVPGFLLQLGTRRVVPAVSGTVPVSGTSTITLADNWNQPTTTDYMIGWNSYESLPNLISRIQNALAQQTGIGELAETGLIEKTGLSTYQAVAFTTFARSLIDDTNAAQARATLGLGGASVVDVTASNTDTTAGRALRVGDFGVGGRGPIVTNANTLSGSGFYTVGSEWLGSPEPGVSGANQGYLSHQDWGGSTYAIQQFTDVNGSFAKSERRRDNNGVWTGWTAILKRGDYGVGSSATTATALESTAHTPSGIYRQDVLGSGISYSPSLVMNSFDGMGLLTIDRLGSRASFRGAYSNGQGPLTWGPPREIVWEGYKGISTDPNTFISPEILPWAGGDLNTFRAGGWYKHLINAGNTANCPPIPVGGTPYWYVFNIRYADAAQIQQYAYNYAGGGAAAYTYMRTFYDGFWSEWRQASAPAVGQVGFANGINTGAIIERGSNANGEYVKFADGTMICWATVLVTATLVSNNAVGTFGWSYYYDNTNIGFPANFASSPVVNATTQGSFLSALAIGTNASGFTLAVITTLAVANPAPAMYMAIGRWR